ncbi:MAG TPA: hypothetical protein VJ869_05535 [Sphaerochaeta sp.]|nr:hypothetical protein [Sphaerochaeta sp.]
MNNSYRWNLINNSQLQKFALLLLPFSKSIRDYFLRRNYFGEYCLTLLWRVLSFIHAPPFLIISTLAEQYAQEDFKRIDNEKYLAKIAWLIAGEAWSIPVNMVISTVTEGYKLLAL